MCKTSKKEQDFKLKDYVIIITSEDKIDVRLKIQKKEIYQFSINYRAYIDGRWHEIYRIDNCHNYLHEQKFWQKKDPIKLEGFESFPLNITFNLCLDKVKSRILQYKEIYFRRYQRIKLMKWLK